MQRLRPLDEAECYLRCYGWRGGEDFVRVLRTEVSVTPVASIASAERIRAALEAMIDSREPEAA